MPPTVPIHHYRGPRNQQNRTKVLFYYSMLMYSSIRPALNTLFFQGNRPGSPEHPVKSTPASLEVRLGPRSARPEARPAVLVRNSTTSFLTATTLIYAIGAGITAAAGTRLALQLFLVKWFKLYSFQLQDP